MSMSAGDLRRGLGEDGEAFGAKGFEERSSGDLALAVLESVGGELFEGVAEGLIAGAEISFEVFVGDEIEQGVETLGGGFFPEGAGFGCGVVEVMADLV